MRDAFVIAHDSDCPTSIILEPDNLAFDHAADRRARAPPPKRQRLR